ncbi:MAG: hypothetical protein KIG85_05100 [Thiopseudomonas sp.]|nr:hypothetical protein [Thiopseudomonas sp.]
MKKLIGAFALAAPMALLATPSAQAETISCVLENNKVVTVSNLSSNPTYTYGTAGKQELVLPTGRANSRVYKGSEGFASGEGQYLAFTNGNYTYAIYDGAGRGWELHGLRVYKGSAVIMEKQCKTFGALNVDLSSINAPEDDLPY